MPVVSLSEPPLHENPSRASLGLPSQSSWVSCVKRNYDYYWSFIFSQIICQQLSYKTDPIPPSSFPLPLIFLCSSQSLIFAARSPKERKGVPCKGGYSVFSASQKSSYNNYKNSNYLIWYRKAIFLKKCLKHPTYAYPSL